MKSILIADDHSLVLVNLSRVLTAAGYFVETVTNGSDAKDALAARSFDFLVTDQMMPGLKGLELVEFVCEAGMDMGLVLMTSFSVMEEVLSAVRAYPKAAVLLKPVAGTKVLETLVALDEFGAFFDTPGGHVVNPEFKKG